MQTAAVVPSFPFSSTFKGLPQFGINIMNAIRCYILVQVTSYSFEVKGAILDESRADYWKQQNLQSGRVATRACWKL